MPLEVADHAVYAQAWVFAHELGGAVAHHRLGHVDGHVAAQRPGGVERVEQHPGLGRRAGAELDELRGAGELRYLVRPSLVRIARSALVG